MLTIHKASNPERFSTITGKSLKNNTETDRSNNHQQKRKQKNEELNNLKSERKFYDSYEPSLKSPKITYTRP